jgi:hypothetical protein
MEYVEIPTRQLCNFAGMAYGRLVQGMVQSQIAHDCIPIPGIIASVVAMGRTVYQEPVMAAGNFLASVIFAIAALVQIVYWIICCGVILFWGICGVALYGIHLASIRFSHEYVWQRLFERAAVFISRYPSCASR